MKKGLRQILRLFKLLMLKNEYITFLRLKVFCTEKGLHHFLMALKVFQGSYSVECW